MGIGKTAIITGGASGMGLEVAKSLSNHGWHVYILDLNAAAAEAVVREHPKLQFVQVNVASWESLSSAFDTIFKAQGRLDFAFANAGILQMDNFYARDLALPPAEPRQHSIDINLKAVINTTHLARHYFLASEHPERDPVLVMTASIASFVSACSESKTYAFWHDSVKAERTKYSQEFNPLYTASKAGVLGFMRSIATQYHKEGIRTYAICPGTVRTNLLTSNTYNAFPDEYLTPVETIVSTVRTLIVGGTMRDARGREVHKGWDYGLAVEIFGKDIYFRDQLEFINDGIRQVCQAASFKNQEGNLMALT